MPKLNINGGEFKAPCTKWGLAILSPTKDPPVKVTFFSLWGEEVVTIQIRPEWSEKRQKYIAKVPVMCILPDRMEWEGLIVFDSERFDGFTVFTVTTEGRE